MATVSPQFVIEGLMRRGYPSHVAQGFVMNMMDESGLNPGINEISPLVPGSRGGFGLYQLTGPRRTAYETFALQRGVDPSDAEAQLDFLDFELRGPESRAAKSILSTQNPQEAAAAIARDFLRPAPENLQKRLARYSGADVAADTMQALGKGKTMTPMVPTAAPQQERKGFLGGLLSDPDLMDRLAIGFAGMTLNPNVGLQQLAASRIASRAEERKAEKETNKTVEMLQRMGADPKLIELAQAGYAKEAIGLAYAQPKEKYTTMTGAQLNAQYGTKVDPEKLYNVSPTGQITQVGGAGTNINLGGSSRDKYFEEEAGDLAKQMTGIRSAGAVAASNINTLRTMRDLYEVSPSGAVVGRFAEMFPEMSDASAVLQSLRTNLAPQLRVEGSGSTSDIEYEGMLRSLGSLRNSPEANKAIIDAMLAKMELNAAKAKIAAQVRPGPNGLDPYDALQQMQALEEQMWVQNPALSLARSLGKGAPIATGSTPVVINGVTIQKVD